MAWRLLNPKPLSNMMTSWHRNAFCITCLLCRLGRVPHYNGVIINALASQITGVSIVYSTVCSVANKKKTSKLRVTGLCEGNSPVTGEFPAQRAGILLIGPQGANFSEIVIELHALPFKKMHLKRSSAKWRLFCLGLNMLMRSFDIFHYVSLGRLLNNQLQSIWRWF